MYYLNNNTKTITSTLPLPHSRSSLIAPNNKLQRFYYFSCQFCFATCRHSDWKQQEYTWNQTSCGSTLCQFHFIKSLSVVLVLQHSFPINIVCGTSKCSVIIKMLHSVWLNIATVYETNLNLNSSDHFVILYLQKVLYKCTCYFPAWKLIYPFCQLSTLPINAGSKALG